MRPPLLEKDAAIGNAVNKGPAANEPNRTAKKNPFTPEFLPRYASTLLGGTQVSSSPRNRRTDGKILRTLRKKWKEFVQASLERFGL